MLDTISTGIQDMMPIPILHGTANGPFLTAWNFYPPIVIGLLLGTIAYYLGLRQLELNGRPTPPAWQIICYYSGLLVVAIALLGPVDSFNDELFFLHMLQHLLLMEIAAPLILLGRPVQLALKAISVKRSGPVLKTVLRPKSVRTILTVITAPLVAVLAFNINLVVWHVPKIYDTALKNTTVHDIEHLMFFGFAFLFWWPIIDPVPRHHKMASYWAIACIFVCMLVGIAIGAILTLSSSMIYPYYLGTAKPWGLTPLTDQQIGGLIMWVGGGFLYLGILIAILINTLSLDDEPTPATRPSDLRDAPVQSS
jgi:putative membrane protein